jgi:hypothetical protein
MKLYRLAILTCVAVLAVGLAMASVASAIPTFKPGTTNKFTTDSGAGTLAATNGESIACESDSGTGEIINEHEAAGITVVFHGCIGAEGGKTCKAFSAGEPEGLIATNTLRGLLGETSEDTSKAAELFEPATGSVFVTPLGSCILKAAVEGSVAGEATPTGVSSKDGKVVFLGGSGVQSIKKVTVKSGGVSPKLSSFGLVASSEATTELVLFTTAVEVT